MAITRLLVRRPGVPHFSNGGLIHSTKSFSFSSSSSDGGSKSSSFLKGSKAVEEGTVVCEEPKRKTGTWLKGILTNIKQKMLGTPELEKPIAGETSVSKADNTASEMTQNTPQDTKFLASQSVLESPEGRMHSPDRTEGVSSCSTSHTVEENAFEGAAVAATSQVGKMLDNPENAGLCDVQSIAQSSEAIMASHGNENDKLRTLASDKMVENSSLKLDQSRKVSDIFVEMMKNEVKQFGEAKSDVLVDCDKERSPCAENLHGLTELISEKPKTVSEGTIASSSVETLKHKEWSPSAEDLLGLISENPKTLSEGNMNYLHGKRSATFVQRPYASTSSGRKQKLSSSLGAKDLENILRRTKNNAITREMAVKVHETLTPTEFSAGKKVEKQQFSDLIKSIKGLPVELSTINSQEMTISNVTDQPSNEGFLNNVQNQANLQNTDAKRRRTSLKQHPVSTESKIPLDKKEESNIPSETISEQEEGSVLSLANSDHEKSDANYHGPLSIGRKELKSCSRTCLIEEGSNENKVLVRFLTKNVNKWNILAAFRDCGPILDVKEVSTTKGSIFKDSLVHFETREGYQTALKKTELGLLNSEAFVEATSSEDMDGTISIPDLIGDPEAPLALIKNPTKTVKVTKLSEDISSQQLKKALTFCQSGISGFFFGSSSSVVYVEFETEDAKERALAEHSIHVSGKLLPILRIDAPRTTVVRISNVKPESKVWAICNSHGQVKHMTKRAIGIVDVHFKLAEWPNMLNIINGLNGLEVNSSRWLVQPAPLFPPRVLEALWSQPEERRHVNAVMCNLLRTLEKPIQTTELSQLTDLVSKYHGKVFN